MNHAEALPMARIGVMESPLRFAANPSSRALRPARIDPPAASQKAFTVDSESGISSFIRSLKVRESVRSFRTHAAVCTRKTSSSAAGLRFEEIAFLGDSLFQQRIVDHPEFL